MYLFVPLFTAVLWTISKHSGFKQPGFYDVLWSCWQAEMGQLDLLRSSLRLQLLGPGFLWASCLSKLFHLHGPVPTSRKLRWKMRGCLRARCQTELPFPCLDQNNHKLKSQRTWWVHHPNVSSLIVRHCFYRCVCLGFWIQWELFGPQDIVGLTAVCVV